MASTRPRRPRRGKWSSFRRRSTASRRRSGSNTRSIFSPGRSPPTAACPTPARPAPTRARRRRRHRRVAAAPARVVVRGQVRERGTREPLVGADVAVIRRGAALDGGDLPAEVVGTTDDDGRFEVRVSAPGALRVVVSDTVHESCVRDFTAAELGGPTPVEWSCFTRERARGLNETRVRGARRTPRGDPADTDQGGADDGSWDHRRPAARAAEHARGRARAVRPGAADRARRQPDRHRRLHRRRADPGPVPLPGGAVGVHAPT